jgi:hypothetical protein
MRGAAVEAPHKPLISDFLANGFEAHQRIAIFSTALSAVVKHVPCGALHFPASRTLVEPKLKKNSRHS